MIFVDTGARYASVIPDDKNHAAARAWLARNDQTLCTSDYIIDETLTLLRVRGHQKLAIEFGRMIFASELAEVIFISQEDLQQAWKTFCHFDDKEWSFTDCTSKTLVERLRIDQAFSFDRHFRQFGTVQVVP